MDNTTLENPPTDNPSEDNASENNASTTPRIEFRGGPAMSVLPLPIFVLVTLALVVFRAPETEGMIVAAMIGISIGMLLARGAGAYNELIFSLMANRVATVAGV